MTAQILCSVIHSLLQGSKLSRTQKFKWVKEDPNESAAIQLAPFSFKISSRSLVKKVKKIFSFYSCFIMNQ